MEPTVVIGLGLGVVGLGLRLVKVPEHFGWGLLAAGVIIVVWGLAPGLKPSGWQLALYAIGVAAIATAAAWQVSEALQGRSAAAAVAPELPPPTLATSIAATTTPPVTPVHVLPMADEKPPLSDGVTYYLQGVTFKNGAQPSDLGEIALARGVKYEGQPGEEPPTLEAHTVLGSDLSGLNLTVPKGGLAGYNKAEGDGNSSISIKGGPNSAIFDIEGNGYSKATLDTEGQAARIRFNNKPSADLPPATSPAPDPAKK